MNSRHFPAIQCLQGFSTSNMAAIIVKAEKPMVFKFKEDGEHFMIGSHVGHSMKLLKGALYKRFPMIWRRSVTSEERQLLSTIGIFYSNLSNANIMLVKAKEVDDILKGNIQAYSPCSSPKRSPGTTAENGALQTYFIDFKKFFNSAKRFAVARPFVCDSSYSNREFNYFEKPEEKYYRKETSKK